MRGYVAKKGNRWYAVIYDGVDPTSGKERRRWVAAGTRKGDAEKLVTEMVGHQVRAHLRSGLVRVQTRAGLSPPPRSS